MQIKLSSVFVQDQEKALRFYTESLGFEKAKDIPLEDHRWLTVTSPQGDNDLELLLEPNVHPAARAFQEAIYKDGIPATVFFVEDLEAVHRKLEGRGVEFTTPPTETEDLSYAIFDDTCGNLIQLVQE